MFGRRSSSESSKSQTGSQRLSGLLHAWRSIEPSNNFDAAVWRRIRTAADVQPTPTSLLAWFVPRPVWMSAAAAFAGVVLGVGLAFSTSRVRDNKMDETLLRSPTLAGSYLTLMAGGNQ